MSFILKLNLVKPHVAHRSREVLRLNLDDNVVFL